jgi:hypothetical protein
LKGKNPKTNKQEKIQPNKAKIKLIEKLEAIITQTKTPKLLDERSPNDN